jgi:hypothetical protein
MDLAAALDLARHQHGRKRARNGVAFRLARRHGLAPEPRTDPGPGSLTIKPASAFARLRKILRGVHIPAK